MDPLIRVFRELLQQTKKREEAKFRETSFKKLHQITRIQGSLDTLDEVDRLLREAQRKLDEQN